MKYYYFVAKYPSGIVCSCIGKYEDKAELINDLMPRLLLNIIELTEEEYYKLKYKYSK